MLKKEMHLPFVVILGTMVLLVGALLAAAPLARPSASLTAALAAPASAARAANPLNLADQANAVYLPLIARSHPLKTIFGVEMGAITKGSGLNMMAQAGSSWVRRNGVLWSSVEPTKGAARNWSVTLDTELQSAANDQMTVILIVRGTPDWAQAIPGKACGPIKTDELASFASFMHDVVARYSVGPYFVKYYELWNEPDIDAALVPGDSDYGCWGDNTDDYYNGGAFGEMLKAVYPQVKAANPAAQVLVGGLLLDCDPNLPGACVNPKPPKFLEGILLDGAGPDFDGVSFHAYDYYEGDPGSYVNPNWDAVGPVVSTKADFLQGVLAAYGFADKYLINTEAALLNDTGGDCDLFCENTKADYVAQVYAAAIAAGLRANVWYSAHGWRGSGLLTTANAPLPAYTAYAFARQELLASAYVADVTGYPGVTGYQLDRGDRQVMVVWSTDGTDHPETLPDTPLAIWDALGNPIAVSGTAILIGPTPLYVEFSP